MDPTKQPSAPPTGGDAGEKSGMHQQPPPYQDYNAGYYPPPGTYPPNQTGYPQGQPYGAQYGQPYQGPYQGQPAVTVQPTIYVAAGPLAQPLPDYLGYSIFTLLCCCLPLGIAALIFSINVSMSDTGYHVKCQWKTFTAFIRRYQLLKLGGKIRSLLLLNLPKSKKKLS